MTKQELLSKMESICNASKNILQAKNNAKEIDNIHKSFKNIKENETCILICGEFKRGKSSFINAYLEQNLCPVDINIATSAVSIIRYGEQLKITRFFGDIQNQKSEVLNTIEDIEKFVKGKTNNIDNTFLVTIEIPNSKLKNGIALIDTPGVGGLDPRHAFLTNYMLPKADIVFFVMDKDSPMTGSEMNFFEKKVLSLCKQKAIILNKADLFKDDNSKRIWIQDIKNKFQNIDTSFDIIAVSSKLKNDFIKSHDNEDFTESNFRAVDDLISKLSEDFTKKRLIELRNYIYTCLDNVYQPLKIQIEQITTPDPNYISKLEGELRELTAHKKELETPNSEYRSKFNKIINKAKENVEIKLAEESIILSSTHLKELAESPQARKNPNWLLEQINNGIGSLAAELDEIIDCAFEQVIDIVGCESNSHQLKSNFDFEIDIDLTLPKKSFGTKACNTARHALPALGVYTIASGIIAFLTGGAALPLLLGGGAALGFLGKNVSDASKKEDTAFFQTQLAPQVQIAVTHLKSYIQSRFKEFNEELLSMLTEETQKFIEDMNSILTELTKLKKEDAAQKMKKSKLLNDEIKPLEQLMNLTKVFLSNPFDTNTLKQEVLKENTASKIVINMDEKTVIS